MLIIFYQLYLYLYFFLFLINLHTCIYCRMKREMNGIKNSTIILLKSIKFIVFFKADKEEQRDSIY